MDVKSSIIKRMKMNLYPDEIRKNLPEIDLEKLAEEKINAIICDVDNTLCRHDEVQISKEKRDWIKKAQSLGMQVILISNNHSPRIEKLAHKLNCQAYGFSLKPLPFTYKKILKRNQLDKKEVICIGDQLFTDIWGAKGMKLRNIYVKPISESDIFYTKLSRKIENWILKEKL